MSKRKLARTIKARSASKIRSKAAGSGQPKGRANSKQARGAGTAVRTERRHHRHRHALNRLATAHGARLAAVVRKKLGLTLASEKTDGERVCRIVAGKASADATSVPSA
jgi:hypothetical protein